MAINILIAVVAAVLAAALCLGLGYGALTSGLITLPTSNSLSNVSSNKSGSGSATAKSGEAPDWQTVASDVSGSVVSIQTALSNGTAKGSGAIIDTEGHIITNNHVISGAQQIQVTLANGNMYSATLVGTDATTDLAVIKLDNPPSDLKAVEFADSDKLAVGENVMAIGNPLGELTYSLTDGLISALDRLITTGSGNDSTTMNMLQTNCAINPGNSGGPLFNSYGEVIGITTAKYSTSSSGTNVEGLGFAIPINDVKNIISDLIQYGYVTGKPYMGITGVTMSASVAQQYGVTNAVLGVYVATVEDGSCSAKAGLQPGDIITAMDEDDVVTFQDLEAAKATHQAGDTVTLTVFRNGEKLELSLTLDEQPRETITDTSSQQQQQPQQNNQYYGWPFGGFFS